MPLNIEVRPTQENRLPKHLPEFFRNLMAARGITSDADLALPLSDLHPPHQLPDVETAARRMADAVTNDERILVVGDYDADGATASALSVSLLRAFGAKHVDFLVPSRFDFGYGLTPELVEVVLEQTPNVIMTVDQGVTSIDGIALAGQHGIDVVVTDHHLPGAQLPAARALVNPNLSDSRFPSKSLAGVGVAYYLMGAVRGALTERDHFEARGIEVPNLADWLDLVVLGTMADVVPLDRNNRILVHQGLRRMRAGRSRPGLQALVEASGRSLSNLTARDIAFAVAPRLNAAGRLGDMGRGIECLLAEDADEAREHARVLNELNRSRREIEQVMREDAEAKLNLGDDFADRASICIHEPGWHQGVIGIVAGRLRQRFHRPAVVFAEAGDADPGVLRGSARSIPGLHVRDAIGDVAARHPGLVERFGGHAMAAGLSIKARNLSRFANAFEDVVQSRISPRDLAGFITVDGTLSVDDLSVQSARLIAEHGPWGQDFEEPQFHGTFDIVAQRTVGGQHLKLTLRTQDKVVDAIAFGQEPIDAEAVEAVFRLEVNDYGGTDTLQLIIEHIAPA